MKKTVAITALVATALTLTGTTAEAHIATPTWVTANSVSTCTTTASARAFTISAKTLSNCPDARASKTGSSNLRDLAVDCIAGSDGGRSTGFTRNAT